VGAGTEIAITLSPTARWAMAAAAIPGVCSSRSNAIPVRRISAISRRNPSATSRLNRESAACASASSRTASTAFPLAVPFNGNARLSLKQRWHPRAHPAATWKDGAQDGPDAKDTGRQGARRYIGRWSLISEYIGSSLLNGAIQFVAPAEMGCPPDSDDAVAVCARLGAGDAPVDVGWFIHHIRWTHGGAEMRSRFWMGGPHIAVRRAPGAASKALRPIASRIHGNPETSGRNLLVHCAQEMNHLAGFLPDLYEAFGNK
jgi:hypothetical protein